MKHSAHAIVIVVVVTVIIIIIIKSREGIFYLTTHSTHFIYGYMTSEY